MAEQHTIYWLCRDDGSRVRLDPGGVLVGRSVTCNVVVPSPYASKRHALVRTGSAGPELLPLGRNETLINGSPVKTASRLADGDRIAFPGAEFTVLAEGPRRPFREPVSWLVERPGLWAVCAHRAEFAVGSGPDDYVFVPDWPPAALRVQVVQGAAVVTASVPFERGGKRLPVGDLIPVSNGDVLTYQGTSLCFTRDRDVAETTVVEQEHFASLLELEFRQSGGVLTVRFEGEETKVRLSELRCRLLAILLQPRAPYAPGDFVPDEIALAAIWPRDPGKDNASLNLLVYRVRCLLVKAGLNPFLLLERAETGGATRIRSGPATEMIVR